MSDDATFLLDLNALVRAVSGGAPLLIADLCLCNPVRSEHTWA